MDFEYFTERLGEGARPCYPIPRPSSRFFGSTLNIFPARSGDGRWNESPDAIFAASLGIWFRSRVLSAELGNFVAFLNDTLKDSVRNGWFKSINFCTPTERLFPS